MKYYKTKLLNEIKETTERVLHSNVDIVDGQYGYYNKEGSFIPVGEAVMVKIVMTNLDTGEQTLVLEVYDAEGLAREVYFPRKDLSEQKILNLMAYGVQVNRSSADILRKSIENQEINAKKLLYHEELGFSEFDGDIIFKGIKAIGIDSHYQGQKNISKKGRYSNWKGMVQKYVIGNIPMELMLTVGASAVVVNFLAQYTQIDNLIVHCISESSTGKTTAGQLAVSCGSSPSLDGSGMVCTFADTQNAIMAAILSAHPVLIDEGSMCQYDPTKLLYNISSGREKARLTKDHNFADSVVFQTTIIITSEKSLLSMCQQNTGLLVRNIQLQGLTYTRNAEESDEIKRVVENNYGFLVQKLAKVLLDLGIKEVLQCWNDFRKQVTNTAKEKNEYNGLTERCSKQTAILLLTASILKNHLDYPLHIDEITNLLDEQSLVKCDEAVDIGIRSYEYILQYVQANYLKFQPVEGWNEGTDRWGEVCDCGVIILKNGVEAKKILRILQYKFEACMRQGGFPDTRIILKRWKELGYLKCEKDRQISEFKIYDGTKVKGYQIYLKSDSSNPRPKTTEKDKLKKLSHKNI